jgi:cytochrome c oxidase subunit 3
MASVVELRPRAREDFTRSLGMIIALGAWAMMFAALFYVYFGVRSRISVWPPPGVPELPTGLAAVNTLVLLASSAALMRGIDSLARGRRAGLARWVLLGLLLGALFLALQTLMWRDLWLAGLLPSSGAFGSVFYGLTGLHAAHVAAGLVVLGVVLLRASKGEYTEHNVVRVRVAAMFWHFVDVVWVLMFLSIYLV